MGKDVITATIVKIAVNWKVMRVLMVTQAQKELLTTSL